MGTLRPIVIAPWEPFIAQQLPSIADDVSNQVVSDCTSPCSIEAALSCTAEKDGATRQKAASISLRQADGGAIFEGGRREETRSRETPTWSWLEKDTLDQRFGWTHGEGTWNMTT